MTTGRALPSQACAVPYRSHQCQSDKAAVQCPLSSTSLFSPSQQESCLRHPIASSSSSSSSSSNFQSVFDAALKAYEKKTKSKLLTHPLAAQLQSCDSPTAILSVLPDLIQQFDRASQQRREVNKLVDPNCECSLLILLNSGSGRWSR